MFSRFHGPEMSVAAGRIRGMNQPLEPLENDLEALRAAWTGALPAFGVLPGSGGPAQTQLEQMSDAGLVTTTEALAKLARDADAMLARVAAEVARRSPAEFGREGLAKKQGFLSPARMVAASTGSSLAAASKLVAVGQATSQRRSLVGEPLPAPHPHVAAALGQGAISVDAAAAITSMLDRVSARSDAEVVDKVEQVLAQRAADIPLDLLYRVIQLAEARLDQDGVAPREEQMRADRCLHFRQDAHGLVHLTAKLDPETAAPVKAAVEAIVTHEIRSRCRQPGASECGGDVGGAAMATDVGPVVEDDRTVPQLQADALAMIARHVIGCTRMPSAPSMAVVVRTDLETLVDGVGHATIDGLDQPVSASTVRKMAATAGVIPAVMGGESLPLDLGRSSRLFSFAQRIALAERDGGCACCGLDIAYVEAHHIRWWERDDGPTDLANGVLLCPPCHTRIHHDNWRIRVGEGNVWFIPPPHVDASQEPRLGGRARFGMPRLDLAG